MPSENAIRRIEIEAFRGFRDRQEFNIDASVVVLAGPNGTGKTSFFDAVQWLLLGKIERLETLRARRSVEHIVNQYRTGEAAIVEADFRVQGRDVHVRRKGDHGKTSLDLAVDGATSVHGDEASELLREIFLPNSSVSLEMALTSSGLLQQDVMRAVLEAKPAERYRHLSTLLGLSDLEDFEDAAAEAERAAQASYERAVAERDSTTNTLLAARDHLRQLEDLQSVRPSLEGLRSDALAAINEAPSGVEILVQAGLPTTSMNDLVADLVGVLEEATSLAADIASTGEREAELGPQPGEEAVAATRDELGARGRAVEECRRDLEMASVALIAAERASDAVARLAAAALPMLDTTCPVCGLEIDPESVASSLRARAQNTDELVALREREQLAKVTLAESERTRAAAQRAVDEITVAEKAWSAVKQRVADEDARLAALGATNRATRVQFDARKEFLEASDSVLRSLMGVRVRLSQLVDASEEGAIGIDIQRSKAEIESTEGVLPARQARVDSLGERARALKKLADATVRARVTVTESRFQALQPLVADIFARLDPHPTFKTMEFELDTYYRRGATTPLVRDPVEDVVADPMLVFSSSQANIAALAYFLATGWTTSERSLPFLLLDDPLQSMDDINVLGFADLCRYLRKSKQLLISTHDRRFGQLLERKLAPRDEDYSALMLSFEAWDRSGPLLEIKPIESQVLEPLIRLVRAS